VLAAKGYELVLVARNEVRLRQLADALQAEHATRGEVLSADLETDAGIARVAARLGDEARPIALLVNNAGFLTTGRFHELPVDREKAEIGLNVVALVSLTHAALQPMVRRGHGGVINVSSVAAYQPMPLSATYSATKAFVSSFTNAIHEELRGTGVKAMTLAPGLTHTELHERAGIEEVDHRPGFLWQSADEVAEAAMRAYDRGRAVCLPGPLNTLTAAVSGAMPAGVTRRVAAVFTRRTW
jgi:hypothetical protein